jgi:phenylalanyl-tRNA synthetase alpha chain
MNDSVSSPTSATLDFLVQEADRDFAAAIAPADLENAKAFYLGKAGRITELLKGLAQAAPEVKKVHGALINEAKQRIEAALNARRKALADAELDQQLRAEALDVTLPGRGRGIGGLHPVTRAMERAQHAGRPSGALDARHLLR